MNYLQIDIFYAVLDKTYEVLHLTQVEIAVLQEILLEPFRTKIFVCLSE